MWKTPGHFQELWETKGTLVLVFLGFPQRVISTALRLLFVLLFRPRTLGPKGVRAAIKPADQTRAVINLEKLLVGLEQPHHLPGQHFTQERPLAVPFETPLLRDAPQVHPGWVIELRQFRRILPGRGHVEFRRRFPLQRLMWAFAVVNPLPGEKRFLLLAAVGRRRIERVLQQAQVQTLMPTILLRTARVDALVTNAQLQPPHRQPAPPARRRP